MREVRMTIYVSEHEWQGTTQIAEADCRLPRDVLRHLLRQELIRRGLLDNTNGIQPREEECYAANV